MWLCQEVDQDQLMVKWQSTAEMPADGLTKVLPGQKHKEFVRQLGLVNIHDLLKDGKAYVDDSPEPEQLVYWH